MKIGVTGASGLVGFNFCELAQTNGDELNILIRKDADYLDRINAKRFYGDLNDLEVLEDFCEGCDVIVHSAAMLSIGFDSYEDVYNVNYTGTENVLQSSINKKVKKFIYISTINAFNRSPSNQILNESRELVKKGNSYDLTKALAQDLVLNNREIETISINPSGIIGKNDFKPSMFGNVLRSIYKNKMPFYIDAGANIIDVEDLCKCIYASISRGKDKECYLVTGEWREFKDIIKSIRKLQKNTSKMIIFPVYFVKMMLPLLSLFPVSFLKKAAKINGKIVPGLENLSKEAIENLLTFPKMVDNSKSKSVLNLKISSLDKTIKDCIDG